MLRVNSKHRFECFPGKAVFLFLDMGTGFYEKTITIRSEPVYRLVALAYRSLAVPGIEKFHCPVSLNIRRTYFF